MRQTVPTPRSWVERAVGAARDAYPKWRALPAPKRGEILFRAAELLVRRKEELARDMTREMGKVLAETRGDVQEAIDMTYYMAGEGRRQFGQTTPSELPNKFQMSVRMPVGTAGLITPWNFPMAIPSWKMMPALVLGNTVVIKPATDTPLSVVNLVRVLEEAGLITIEKGYTTVCRRSIIDDPAYRKAMTFNGQDVAELYLKVLSLGGKSGYMKYRTVPVFPQVGDKINKAIERIATKQQGARDAMKQAQLEAIEDLKKAGVKLDA